MILFAGVSLCSLLLHGQEDVVSSEEMLIEQQNINFQTFFFEALQQKSIGNYDKAVYALEACNNIDKKNVAVLFELSKNYALLFKYTEAEYYILKGLEIEPVNLYLLRHYKEIKTKQNDFPGAIKVQNRIIELEPEEESDLVILYIKSGEIEKAIELLKKLDEQQKIPEGLMALKDSLLHDGGGPVESDPGPVPEEMPKSKSDRLKEDFELKKDFNSLKLLLEREWKTKQYLKLLEDSSEGLSLFPAQPYLYLMNGRAQNSIRKHQEAIDILEEGIDYIIDDNEMEALFYEELSLSYKAMGNNKKATEYYNRSLEIRGE
jgi:tetratricopeptide (TPR) repeat protein